MAAHPVQTAKTAPAQTDRQVVHEVVGMRKWMRLTARKHFVSKRAENDASQAAADALALLLRDARKLG